MLLAQILLYVTVLMHIGAGQQSSASSSTVLTCEGAALLPSLKCWYRVMNSTKLQRRVQSACSSPRCWRFSSPSWNLRVHRKPTNLLGISGGSAPVVLVLRYGLLFPASVTCDQGFPHCIRPRRRMLHPRSEPQIFGVLDSLCDVVSPADAENLGGIKPAAHG